MVQLRDFTHDKHRTVDDTPFGGGAGMVLKPEPILEAVESLGPRTGPVVVMSARGRRFGHDDAVRWSLGSQLTIVCGHYKDIDQRVVEILGAEEVSIGDFVLSGGEVPAMAVIDALTRRLEGALGDACSAREDSFATGLLDHPHFTRPEVVDGMSVPPILLSGNHAAIARWRRQQALGRTAERRPDLLAGLELSAEDRRLLDEYLAQVRVRPRESK